MAKPKTNRIVVYKLTEAMTFSDIDLSSHDYELQSSTATDDTKLYIKVSHEKKPQWADYISPYLNEGTEIVNSSCSFVLIKESNGSLFALAGGHGFHAVKNICEDDFGLRVAVRIISEEGIAALQQKPLKGSTRQVHRSLTSYDPTTDGDNYNRILKFVEGEGEFEGRTFRIGGRSSLTLRTTKSITDFGEVISEIEEILERDERVKLPKSYKIITDDDTLQPLNEALQEAFSNFWQGSVDRDSMYLEFDDPLAQTRATNFKISCGRKTVTIEDFDLTILREALREEGITDAIKVLENARVFALDENGYPLTEVRSFVNALSFDYETGGKVYLKQGKQWLEVLEDIQTHIEERISEIHVERDYLPSWTPAISRESEYNQLVASEKGWGCLDADFVQVAGRSKIELCDLYDHSQKRFVHVKKTWGSQSSYLFLQAATAAQTYYEDRSIREKCQSKWGHFFDGSFEAGSTIVIAVAAKAQQLENFPSSMTYFAKLNLYNAVRTIQSSGYQVCLAPILLEEAA